MKCRKETRNRKLLEVRHLTIHDDLWQRPALWLVRPRRWSWMTSVMELVDSRGSAEAGPEERQMLEEWGRRCSGALGLELSARIGWKDRNIYNIKSKNTKNISARKRQHKWKPRTFFSCGVRAAETGKNIWDWVIPPAFNRRKINPFRTLIMSSFLSSSFTRLNVRLKGLKRYSLPPKTQKIFVLLHKTPCYINLQNIKYLFLIIFISLCSGTNQFLVTN